MAEPLYRQLHRHAWSLATLDPRRPKQGNLRRAVSAAYYALFHFLIDHACRAMLGSANDRRPYRDVLSRAFQHDIMVGACKSFAGTALPKHIHDKLAAAFAIPPELQEVAQTFREAQEKRHVADYVPSATFARADVLLVIQSVLTLPDSM